MAIVLSLLLLPSLCNCVLWHEPVYGGEWAHRKNCTQRYGMGCTLVHSHRDPCRSLRRFWALSMCAGCQTRWWGCMLCHSRFHTGTQQRPRNKNVRNEKQLDRQQRHQYSRWRAFRRTQPTRSVVTHEVWRRNFRRDYLTFSCAVRTYADCVRTFGENRMSPSTKWRNDDGDDGATEAEKTKENTEKSLSPLNRAISGNSFLSAPTAHASRRAIVFMRVISIWLTFLLCDCHIYARPLCSIVHSFCTFFTSLVFIYSEYGERWNSFGIEWKFSGWCQVIRAHLGGSVRFTLFSIANDGQWPITLAMRVT